MAGLTSGTVNVRGQSSTLRCNHGTMDLCLRQQDYEEDWILPPRLTASSSCVGASHSLYFHPPSSLLPDIGSRRAQPFLTGAY